MNPAPFPASRRLLAILAAGSVFGLAIPAAQGDTARQDHEVARRALAAGEILPLRKILERVEQAHPGEIIEVELEQKDGHWVYEVKLLEAGGHINKLILDARDARMLERKKR